MDATGSCNGLVVREVAKLGFAVAATELIHWVVRVWRWVSSRLSRWPWLVERYALIFPVVPAIALLAFRRWSRARSQ